MVLAQTGFKDSHPLAATGLRRGLAGLCGAINAAANSASARGSG
jgi:hypothetical protein